MVFLDNCVEGILINTGCFPVTSVQLPFLSYGVGSTVTYAVFIGDILQEQAVTWSMLPAQLLVNGILFGLFLLAKEFRNKQQEHT